MRLQFQTFGGLKASLEAANIWQVADVCQFATSSVSRRPAPNLDFFSDENVTNAAATKLALDAVARAESVLEPSLKRDQVGCAGESGQRYRTSSPQGTIYRAVLRHF